MLLPESSKPQSIAAMLPFILSVIILCKKVLFLDNLLLRFYSIRPSDIWAIIAAESSESKVGLRRLHHLLQVDSSIYTRQTIKGIGILSIELKIENQISSSHSVYCLCPRSPRLFLSKPRFQNWKASATVFKMPELKDSDLAT